MDKFIYISLAVGTFIGWFVTYMLLRGFIKNLQLLSRGSIDIIEDVCDELTKAPSLKNAELIQKIRSDLEEIHKR